jgi:RNA polymerase sigma-70 factor (ECF subfamily)
MGPGVFKKGFTFCDNTVTFFPRGRSNNMMARCGLAIKLDHGQGCEPKRDPREEIERYLPLSEQRIRSFLDDWEGLVLSCLRRMRVDDEEDVLYRVFSRAVAALPGFRGQSKISTWLYQIAWREGIRHLEKQRHQAKREILSNDISAEIGSGDSAEQILETMETKQRVRDALSELGPVDREILALRYQEELQLSEVAERLDIPLGTVKARTHRALGRLRKILEGKDDE